MCNTLVEIDIYLPLSVLLTIPSGGGLSGLGGMTSGVFFWGIAAFGISGTSKILVFS